MSGLIQAYSILTGSLIFSEEFKLAFVYHMELISNNQLCVSSTASIQPQIIELRRTRILDPVAKQIPWTQEAAWTALGKDPEVAGQAMAWLIKQPGVAVNLAKSLTREYAMMDLAGSSTALGNLESSNFSVRQKSIQAIEAAGDLMEPALLAAHNNAKTLEGKRRIQRLLENQYKNGVSPKRLQTVRLVEVLEKMGTGDARACLVELGQGDFVTVAKEEACNALRRMAVRSKGP